jgi:hypothetical protein
MCRHRRNSCWVHQSRMAWCAIWYDMAYGKKLFSKERIRIIWSVVTHVMLRTGTGWVGVGRGPSLPQCNVARPLRPTLVIRHRWWLVRACCGTPQVSSLPGLQVCGNRQRSIQGKAGQPESKTEDTNLEQGWDSLPQVPQVVSIGIANYNFSRGIKNTKVPRMQDQLTRCKKGRLG